MSGNLGAFLVVAVLVVVTPGQDTALTIRNTLLGGRRAGFLTAVGVVSGQAAWTVATSVGLAALLVASEPAFAALRLGGALYLVLLGLRALAAAARGGGHGPAAHAGGRTGLRAAAAYRQGLLSNLGNAKIAVFFTSLLPQFAVTGDGRAPVLSFLALGLILVAITLVWLALYVAAVDRAKALFARSAVRRALDAVLGAALVAFGVRLAAASR